jgi:hypothetical protein
VIARVLDPGQRPGVPLALRLAAKFPILRRIPGRLIGMGIRPEHVKTPYVC